MLIAVSLTACGSPDPGSVDADSGALQEEVDGEVMERFTAARQAQAQVLEETADVVAAGGEASTEEVEAALLQLNIVLMEGRQTAMLMRRTAAPGQEDLLKDLRQGNSEVRDAYSTLLVHHPDPASLPELVLEHQVGQ